MIVRIEMNCVNKLNNIKIYIKIYLKDCEYRNDCENKNELCKKLNNIKSYIKIYFKGRVIFIQKLKSSTINHVVSAAK